jgi:hypothetical protein
VYRIRTRKTRKAARITALLNTSETINQLFVRIIFFSKYYSTLTETNHSNN